MRKGWGGYLLPVALTSASICEGFVVGRFGQQRRQALSVGHRTFVTDLSMKAAGLNAPPSRKSVFLSHDGGVDDLVTQILLCQAHAMGAVKLLGVAVTAADCEIAPAVLVSRKVLDLAAKHYPAAGFEEISVSECDASGVNPFPSSWRKAAYAMCHMPQVLRDGPPRARLSPKRASQAMAEALVQAGEGCPVTLVETGPLSCIDEMLKTCDELVRSRIESIVWMGGALDAGGNVVSSGTDCSQEWNAYWDPPAVARVAASGVPLVICPLDATNQAPITTSLLTRLSVEGENSTWGHLVASFYATTMHGMPGDLLAGYFAWDVLTASYVLWPEIFDSEMERIGVCVEGKRQGAIYRKVEGGSAVRVLTRVDAAQWEDRLVRALCSNTGSSGTL